MATANDERESRIHGESTANDARDARIHGAAATNDARDARLHGIASTDEYRDARIHGAESPIDERSARINGENGTERDARIQGDNGMGRDARIEGDTGVGRWACIDGIEMAIRQARIWGRDDTTWRDGRIHGENGVERSARIYGDDGAGGIFAYNSTAAIPARGAQRRSIDVAWHRSDITELQRQGHSMVDDSKRYDVVGIKKVLHFVIGRDLLDEDERTWWRSFFTAAHQWAALGVFVDMANESNDKLCKAEIREDLADVSIERDTGRQYVLYSEKVF